MNQDAVSVRQINLWTALPSLRLVEAIRFGFSLQCLFPCLLCVLVLHLLAESFSVPLSSSSYATRVSSIPLPMTQFLADTRTLFVAGLASSTGPAMRILILLLAVGFTSCAVGRSAGLQFCNQRRVGAIGSIRWTTRQWRPIMVALGLSGICLVLGVLLFKVLSGLAALTGGSEPPRPLSSIGLSLVTTILALSGAIGFAALQLSLAGISIDGCDGAESLSRGISYVLSAFWRVVCYAFTVALLISVASELTWSFLSWCGEIAELSLSQPAQNAWVPSAAFQSLRIVLMETVKLSIFLSGSTICYVLLRHFVDNISLAETEAGRTSTSSSVA